MFTKCEVTSACTSAMQIRRVARLHPAFPHVCSLGAACVSTYMQMLMHVCVCVSRCLFMCVPSP